MMMMITRTTTKRTTIFSIAGGGAGVSGNVGECILKPTGFFRLPTLHNLQYYRTAAEISICIEKDYYYPWFLPCSNNAVSGVLWQEGSTTPSHFTSATFFPLESFPESVVHYDDMSLVARTMHHFFSSSDIHCSCEH